MRAPKLAELCSPRTCNFLKKTIQVDTGPLHELELLSQINRAFMELKQQLVIPRAIEVVWQALNDPD